MCSGCTVVSARLREGVHVGGMPQEVQWVRLQLIIIVRLTDEAYAYGQV